MKKNSFCRSIAAFWIFLPLIANADPTILKYALSPTNRLEIHLSENSADDKPIKVFLFDHRLNGPLPISVTSNDSKLMSMAHIKTSYKKFTLPQPDQMPATLPDWIEIDSTDSTRRNLKEEGMLVIRELGNQASPSIRVHPLEFDLKYLNSMQFFMEEPPRTTGFNNRHYSFALPQNANLNDLKNNSLLVSVIDTNQKSEFRNFGTIVVSQNGRGKSINLGWTDFLKSGLVVEFSPSKESGQSTILFNGKPWDPRGAETVYTSDWHSQKFAHAFKSGGTEEPIRSEEHEKQLGFRLQQIHPKFVGNPFRRTVGLNARAIEEERRDSQDLQSHLQELEMDRSENMELVRDMHLINEVVKNSAIGVELVQSESIILGHHLKFLPIHGQTKQYVVFSAFLKKKDGTKSTKNWILTLDMKTDQLVGLFKIPESNKAEDVRMLPYGNLMLKDGEFINLSQVSSAASCAHQLGKK